MLLARVHPTPRATTTHTKEARALRDELVVLGGSRLLSDEFSRHPDGQVPSMDVRLKAALLSKGARCLAVNYLVIE